MSSQLAERATVNAINLGPVKTEMWGGLMDEFRDYMYLYIRLVPTGMRLLSSPWIICHGTLIRTIMESFFKKEKMCTK